MVNINLKIQKKDLLLLSMITILLVGIGVVIAYNSGVSPSIMGHDADEVEITILGTNYNLQYAIDNNLLSSVSLVGSLETKDCYVFPPHRQVTSYCKNGFYLKSIIGYLDNNWDGFGGICCRANSTDDPALPNIQTLMDACPWGYPDINCLDSQTYPTGQYSLRTYGICENSAFGTCNCGSSIQVSKTNSVASCSVDPAQVDTMACSASSGSNAWSTCCVCRRN